MSIHKVSQLVVLAVAAISLTGALPAAVAAPPAGDVHSAAYMGVMVEAVSPEVANALHLKEGSGAAITGVDQDGPACRAGLKTGDVVVAFNGKPVEGPNQLAGLIHSSAPGTTVSMTVARAGQNKEMKVTLGDWKQMAGMPNAPAPMPGMAFVPPMAPLPPRMYPDVDMPGFTSQSARHGVVVEPLSPQLCDFFGVPQNKGVLVRTVEKGSPGAAAGLRAGDVIVKVNSETVHDMADWRRALKTHNGKVTLAIVRDKKEQTVEMILPPNTSELKGQDWDTFDQDMRAMTESFAKNAQEMATLAQLDQHQVDEINRQARDATKNAVPDLKKQAEEMRKQADAAMKAATPEMKKRAEELRKQAEEMRKQTEGVRKEVEKMAPQMEKDAMQMADSMKPTAKELAAMARDMQKTMKEMTPELQKQMEQIKKDMEKEKREWQEIFKGTDPNHF
jgi:serine protease Do